DGAKHARLLQWLSLKQVSAAHQPVDLALEVAAERGVGAESEGDGEGLMCDLGVARGAGEVTTGGPVGLVVDEAAVVAQGLDGGEAGGGPPDRGERPGAVERNDGRARGGEQMVIEREDGGAVVDPGQPAGDV